MKAVKKHGRKLVVAAGVMLATFAGAAGVEKGSKKSTQCVGDERWLVKTLQDEDGSRIDFDSPTKISIADILQKIRGDEWSKKKDNPRLEDEFEVYKVRGKIKYVAQEDDGDIHIQLADENNPKLSIIAEIPNPDCKITAKSEYKDVFRDARNDFTNKYQDETVWSTGVFEIVGVLFHDARNHGHGGNQEGVELHPVISIKKLKK